MAVTSPSVLPGNILSLADSDFESGSPTWAALTNATAPAAVSTYAFSGVKSLKWTASAAGDSFIATGFYPCVQNKGYDFSGYIQTVTAGHDTYIGVEWFNSSHTQIGSTVFGNVNPSTAGAWQSIVLAATSPAGAAFFKLVVWVSLGVAASEIFAIDLMYASTPPAQVLIDFSNPAFSVGSLAGQDFTDVSMWIRWDKNISMTHGRQDAISEIQAGQSSFYVQNDSGWFTPQLSTSPFYPNVSLGCRTQINVQDKSGNWYTRFDGAISQITYTVDNTGGTNLANISLSDVLATMNRQDPMFCWTKEAVLYDGPWLHWTLDDTGTTGLAAETSGNNGPPLRLVDYSTGTATPAATWRNGNGGVETLADASAPGQPDGSQWWQPGTIEPTSRMRGLASGAVGPIQTPLETIYLAPALTTQTVQNQFTGTDGYQLNGELVVNGVPTPIAPTSAGTDYTVECWFTQDPTIRANAIVNKNLGPHTVLSLGSTRTNSCVTASVSYTGSGGVQFLVQNYSQPPAYVNLAYNVSPPSAVYSSSGQFTIDKVPLPHHLVMIITGGSPPTMTIWLDGANLGTMNLIAGTTYDQICVGGAYGGHGAFYGNIALVSIYQYALSFQHIAEHCRCGQYGMWESPTDLCITRAAKYARTPTFWNNLAGNDFGLTLTEYMSIAGESPLSTMQAYEKAEQGLLFVNTAGQLTFHTRDWRMGYGAADLTLPADVYTPDLGYELIDTGLLNEAATATITYTQGVDWQNPVSGALVGTYANGTAGSPVQLPLITWSRAYSSLGLANTTGTSFANNSSVGISASVYGYYPDPNLNDQASWQVFSSGTPALVCGQLTVDLLTLDSTSGVTVTQIYGLDIDNMITLAGLPGSFPDQAGANDYFIEGINETVGVEQWMLTLYTSPASLQRAWKPGDATYGVLGTTSRLGVSAPDVSVPPALGKSVAHDAGAPYWPPTFSTTMNNPSGNGHDFIGANDIRGLAASLSTALNPPLLVLGTIGHATSYLTGNQGVQGHGVWDTVFIDTAGGMGIVPNWPNWYCVMVPGFYEISATFPWQVQASGAAGVRTSWIIVAEAAAQAIAAGTGTPYTGVTYSCPVGEQINSENGSNSVQNPITRIYCGVGDMINAGVMQTNGSSLNSSTGAANGPFLSLRWVGYNTVADQIPQAFAPASGAPAIPGVTTTSVQSFLPLNTYAYYGTTYNTSAFSPQQINTNLNLFQGSYEKATGSRFSFVLYSSTSIVSALSGKTIKSVTLTITNASSYYSTGADLMLGYTTFSGAFGTSFTPGGGTFFDLKQAWFRKGQTRTIDITDTGIGAAFQNGTATGLVLGNNKVTNPDYAGQWTGGTGPSSAPKLTFTYHS